MLATHKLVALGLPVLAQDDADAEQAKRAVAVEGVDKILARLEQLQASATTAAAAEASS
ncbi:MAG: hypothetical protein IID36_11245 [Planctomycetes bacterium]|nr:hypothetical protein [Planctomycetota bacterium]